MIKLLATIEDLFDHISPKLGDLWFEFVVCAYYRRHVRWQQGDKQ